MNRTRTTKKEMGRQLNEAQRKIHEMKSSSSEKASADRMRMERKLQKEIKEIKKGKNTGRGHNIQDEIDLYVRQLLDPWSTYNAVVPDVHSYPTCTFSVATPFTLTTGAAAAADEGRCCIFVRDGLTSHYIRNNASQGVTAINYNSGWQLNDNSVWAMSSEQSSIRGAFSAYRPVAMGVRMTYSGPPTTASGRLAMGYFPGTQGLPFLSNGDATYALTYDAFSQYQDVITGSAISGGTVIWKPMTPEVEFRQTKAWIYDGSADTFPSFAINNVEATWDTDPQALPAIQALGFYVDSDAAVTESVMSAAGKLQTFSLPQQSPCLVMMAEGLPAGVEVFAGEIIVHYEGVADNRGFSIVQPSHRVARPDSMKKALSRVNQVHPAHSGGTLSHHTNWLEEAVKITSNIASTAGAISGVVNTVPRVVAPLLEAAETVAALF